MEPTSSSSSSLRGPNQRSRFDAADLAVRFAVGGTAVVFCYLIARLSPWRAFGGMFAAFPAVMAAAVGLAGMRGGHDQAADTAMGAVSGMLAGTVCVASCLAFVAATNSWQISLGLAMVVWFGAAAAFSSVVNPLLRRRQASRDARGEDEAKAP